MHRFTPLFLSALAPLALLACGPGPDAPPDAAAPADARAPTPISLRLASGGATVAIDTDPLRIRVLRGEATVLESAPGAAIEIGSAPGGDTRWHAPIAPDPPNVTWHALDLGLDAVSETEGTLTDGAGHVARIVLGAIDDGVIRARIEVESGGDDVALVRARFADDGGAYHGLGERFGGADARGSIVPMQLALADAQARTSGTNEHHVPIPFVVSSSAWGLFVETREAGAFDVASSAEDEVRATFEGRVLDLVFFVGDRPSGVIAAYTRHTGLPILPPRWVYAPMHWRNEWSSRAQLEEDAQRIRDEDIPCTTFWIDNPWQTSYNDLRFDGARFPDAAGMLAAMRDAGYVPLLWSTPYLDAVDEGASPTNDAEQLFVEARDAGWLVRTRTGAPYLSPAAPGAQGGMIDFTVPEASAFWQARIAPLIALGVRGFKLDYGEDIVPEIVGARPGFRFAGDLGERELHNVYNTRYHEPYRRALDEGGGDDGGFLLVRASSWGGQRVADVIWPGDLDNDLRRAGSAEVGGLPAAISGMISLAASGFPNFGSDTGGYRGGMPDRESLLRWAEHTAFSPILQLGGAGDHHNPWLYDAEAGAIYRALARAHMDLVPYLRAHARRASADGTPPILHPSLAYPGDRAGYSDPDAYLLGTDLFVAPVVEPGATSRALHLPPGRWVHFWTGDAYEGASDVTVAAPIGTPPVFVRVGALLPLLPADLDTLVEVAPPLVSPSQRPFLRARWIPAGDASIETEEGLAIDARHTAADTLLTITPRAGGVSDLRVAIDLAHADPPRATIAGVRANDVAVPSAADAASVESGCDGTCWFRDGDVLYVSVRSATATTITVR